MPPPFFFFFFFYDYINNRREKESSLRSRECLSGSCMTVESACWEWFWICRRAGMNKTSPCTSLLPFRSLYLVSWVFWLGFFAMQSGYFSGQDCVVMHVHEEGYELHFAIQRRLNVLDHVRDAVEERGRKWAWEKKSDLIEIIA